MNEKSFHQEDLNLNSYTLDKRAAKILKIATNENE